MDLLLCPIGKLNHFYSDMSDDEAVKKVLNTSTSRGSRKFKPKTFGDGDDRYISDASVFGDIKRSNSDLNEAETISKPKLSSASAVGKRKVRAISSDEEIRFVDLLALVSNY
jgi:hypothetical protein